MPVQQYSVTIRRPRKRVFDYVTTPAWWPIYHPTSKQVDPFVTHSLAVGESTVETCKLGALGLVKFVIHWVGTENDGEGRFVMQGKADQMGGAQGTITYELGEENGVTRFQRTFDYRIDGLFGRMFGDHARQLRDHAAQVRAATRADTPEMALFSNPIDDIINELIARDGRKSLDKVKAILESMPC